MKRLRGLRLGHSWQSVRALSVPSHFSVLYAPIILMHVAVTVGYGNVHESDRGYGNVHENDRGLQHRNFQK